MRTAAVVLLALALAPPSVRAQGEPARPARLARAEVGAFLGSFSVSDDDIDTFQHWSHSVFRSLTAGWYWTDHLRADVEVGWAGEGETYGSAPAGVPGAPWAHLYFRRSSNSVMASPALSWQFGRNAWVHPLVTAGLDVAREEMRTEREPQFIETRAGISMSRLWFPAAESSETRVVARPFAAAGLKAYFTERGFFRTDLKLGFRGGLDQVTWRIGLGMDF